MAWLSLLANVAGLWVLVVAFGYSVVFLLRHARGKVHPQGASWLAMGTALLVVAAGISYGWGWTAAYELWINIKAPSRLWQTPSIAVAGPEIAMGGTAAEVRSFRGDVELYATAVTVRRDGADLVVSSLRFEVLKRSATLDPVETGTLRSRVYRRNLRHYTGRRGSGVAIDLSRVAESPLVPVTLQLSNVEPYRSTGSVEFRIRDAANHCQRDCGVGFALLYGAQAEAATTAINLMQR